MMSSSGPNGADRHFWDGRNVLVTGAGGFVASWLCKALVEAGASVVGVIRDSPAERLLALHGIRDRIGLVHGSTTNYELVERAINEYEIDTCFHLAAQAIVGAANRAPLSTFETNIKGTWNVLEACRVTSTVKRVVVASSDKVYGNQPEVPYQEATSLNGRYPYDASKVCTDVLAQCYAVTYDLPVAISRFANIYGGGDFNWSRLVPGTVRSVLRGEVPVIRSDGTLERDYLYITDAIEAYLMLGQRAAEPGIRGQAFNFGRNAPASVLAVVNQILAATGSALHPLILGQAKTEILRQYLDSSLARAVLGWESRVDLAEGLARTIPWYAEHLHVPMMVAADWTAH